MYDPVVEWLKRVIADADDAEKALEPYRGINKKIDKTIDQLLKDIENG